MALANMTSPTIPLTRRRSGALLDEEALDRRPYGTVDVPEGALGHPHAGRAEGRPGVEAHPGTDGRAVHEHRQVGVDEEVALEVEEGTDAVAEVAGGGHTLEGRGFLAGDDGDGQPHPHGGGASPTEVAGHEAQL